jgi:FAD/FMN-containing dehydrogenase
VLVESMGTDATLDATRFQGYVEAAFERGVVVDALIARSLRESKDIWAIRDSSGELQRIIGHYVPFDISLPIGAIGRFVEDCRQRIAARWPDLATVWFGHIADSNLHICVAAPGGPEAVHELDELVYERVGEFRGSISAEHGIGLLKRDFLARSRTPEAIAAMRVLKQALDPNGILNPGKVLA